MDDEREAPQTGEYASPPAASPCIGSSSIDNAPFLRPRCFMVGRLKTEDKRN